MMHHILQAKQDQFSARSAVQRHIMLMKDIMCNPNWDNFQKPAASSSKSSKFNASWNWIKSHLWPWIKNLCAETAVEGQALCKILQMTSHRKYVCQTYLWSVSMSSWQYRSTEGMDYQNTTRTNVPTNPHVKQQQWPVCSSFLGPM